MIKHRYFLVFLLFWVVLNIVTAIRTELYADEAYYWMYSQFLDWGYFDHPPGVALVIKLGEFFGKNEFGVRIANILITATSIALIYRETKPKNVLIYCLTVFSFLVLHLIGFLSLPDGPFFLSGILFLLAYKKFLKNMSLKNQFMLALTAALMIYCKYHGFVVILFTLASNLALFKKYQTYIVAIIAFTLISPHVYWQVTNDFPSLSYHLADRAAPEYSINQTLEFLFGNLPFLGGLVAVILFIAAFYFKPTDKWEKAMKWNLFGMFIFFLLITFKGQFIEANWTLFCVFPILVLGYRQIENSKYFNAYKYFTYIFAGLMLLIRIHILSPFGVFEKDRVWDFYGSTAFAKDIKKAAGASKIAANRYQEASLLNFYLDEPYTIPALNINFRANQYSIWQFDKAFCNENLVYVNRHLDGEKVHRNFQEFMLSDLHKVAFINCQEVKILDHEQNEKSLNLKVALADSPSEIVLNNFSFIIAYYQEKEKIKDFEIDLNDLEFQENLVDLKLELPDNEKLTSLSLQLKSKKLGGINNQRVKINLK